MGEEGSLERGENESPERETGERDGQWSGEIRTTMNQLFSHWGVISRHLHMQPRTAETAASFSTNHLSAEVGGALDQRSGLAVDAAEAPERHRICSASQLPIHRVAVRDRRITQLEDGWGTSS